MHIQHFFTRGGYDGLLLTNCTAKGTNIQVYIRFSYISNPKHIMDLYEYIFTSSDNRHMHIYSYTCISSLTKKTGREITSYFWGRWIKGCNFIHNTKSCLWRYVFWLFGCIFIIPRKRKSFMAFSKHLAGKVQWCS